MRSIELLEPDLLKNDAVLREIDHWLAVMHWTNGWHYDLDIVWLVETLARAGVKPGMTVLDAGAGLGVTQFVLAARGYRVISLDYAPRDTPKRAQGIFHIEHRNAPELKYQHSYLSQVDLVERSRSFRSAITRIASRLVTTPSAATKAVGDVRRRVRDALVNFAERRRDHSHFGSIEFVQASFHEIPVPDKSVDAVVSVSAVEHSEKDIIAKAFADMRRITRAGGPILITTSATREPRDTFNEPTRGHCFARESLETLIGGVSDSRFEYDRVERAILGSRLFWSRVDPYYYRWPNSLFSGRRPDDRLPYLPVGLRVE